MTPLLKIDGLTKTYPGVVANDDVSLSIAPGEVHALLGENGAGKSTLVKTIFGLNQPDKGRMEMDGTPYAPSSPEDARVAGVGMVFQHFSLFEALDVAENVALGMSDPPPMRDLSQRIETVSRDYGLPLKPGQIVGDLSAGERQRVEIVRCLLGNPRLLIMDEPTSVLTPQEVDLLFKTLRQLRDEGTSILYISHKLEEIRALCDTATILRGGKVVATCTPSEESAGRMAELMVGRRLDVPARAGTVRPETLLQIDRLSVPAASEFGTALKEVSLTLKAGEVLGIGGVAGNGQDELVATLAGETRSPADTIFLERRDISRLGPEQRRVRGLLTAPEERLGHAAAPDLSLTENGLLSAATSQGLARRGFVDWRAARRFAESVIERFDVRTPGPGTVARALSGGNLQKFVIGREIAQDPLVLVVNQPTWGVDAAAAATIRQALLDLAGEGSGVIVISQDLDELMQISDRFAALTEGRLSPFRPAAGLTVEEIGLMLGGAHDMEPAHAH
ncbi:nucleoside ABC transporter ATP-binding protein [Palleronia marisminoris]|uniref:Galactose/methyl galactoside import ATP-binding protein MglA n=1 Tax=Palleronia marisminoris TaxID=315423 RepID=A0A1Y5RQB5_9RHOB|nr:ABC transporter ATP-binding protein [Palleronia marisminoris]SFG55109.1 nucleoside ABC transporter ATP-binding protein [Palleronia marisminoris]SLN22885.1 Galactose/methyl galactoside import ATP-binding protein MglA [Palleronia marisminoris]